MDKIEVHELEAVGLRKDYTRVYFNLYKVG